MPQRTSHTLTKAADLIRDLQQVAERGYAVDDQEDTDGVVCIGAGVFDHSGAVAGAISVTGLKQSLQGGEIASLSRTLVKYADRISHAMGGPAAGEAWTRYRNARPAVPK